MNDAVIVSAVRSPIGRAHKGSLREMRSDEMAHQITSEAIARVPGLQPEQIDDLVLGCGIPEGENGSNLARVVAVRNGWDTVPGTTVTRFCASSVQSTRMALHAIRAGEGEIFVSAGVESTSSLGRHRLDSDVRNPHFRDAWQRTAKRAEGGAQTWSDPRGQGLVPDIYIAMGQTAENVAQLRSVSRADQDAWALLSQQRAQAAAERGFWDKDITALTLPDGSTVSTDDSPRPGTTAQGLAELEPVFRPDGTVTAGNACPLNDGAAALVIMSSAKAAELGVQPLARIVSTGLSALSPEIMGLGPVTATRQALQRAGMGIKDIDLVELNEAFAAQVLPSAEDLGIDHDRLNVNGGAIALGHPWGMTGARITTTLINSLTERGAGTGLVTMCVGGGQGMAMVIERLG